MEGLASLRVVDLSDGILLLRWLFNGGPPHILAVPGDEQFGCITIFGCPTNDLCP